MCILGSQADTYIEKRFEILCSEGLCAERKREADTILNQWRKDKELFSSYTAISGFDFQHYSLHDKSHSIAILNAIEKVLGKDRVDLLSASDLWLLLESAYSHDIGMSLTYEDLCNLWETNEFRMFVENCLQSEWGDKAKCVALYKEMDRLVKKEDIWSSFYNTEDYDGKTPDLDEWNEHREELDEIFSTSKWPVVFERYILLLSTEFIRKKHPERSYTFLEKYRELGDKQIPNRAYDTVMQVVKLHGMDFSKIFVYTRATEDGLNCDVGNYMHPQFAAAMLRLGDLLDMDSNRFNIRMIKHMGILPVESTLHFKKHKAISHLLITDYTIEAEARSDDYDVCLTTNQWFQWLDQEVKDLICCWNQICPKEFIGCRLNKCKLEIYCKNTIFDATKRTKFRADPDRVYKMLIGENIYKSKLDFIREYIQNAMDASKMQLWLDMKENYDLWHKYSPEEIVPFQLPVEWYDKYEIEIQMHIDWDNGAIDISFKDSGIGMESKCVSALSNVAGDGWKQRENYGEEIRKMPVWLRPTGGFGIGIQSAFMVTDRVEFITKSRLENIGRKIILDSNKRGGRVSESILEHSTDFGTKVILRIPLDIFLLEIMNHDGMYLYHGLGNIYDRSEISKVILTIVKKYVKDTAKYSLIPIRVICDREVTEKIVPEWIKLKKTMARNVDLNWEIFVEYNKKIGYVWLQDSCLLLWNYSNETMVIYDNGTELKDHFFYKGICITDETRPSELPFGMDIIYYGRKVNSFLTISRDKFKQAERKQCIEDRILYRNIYFLLLLKQMHENIFEDNILINTCLYAIIMNYLGLLPNGSYQKEIIKLVKRFAERKIAIKRVSTDIVQKVKEDKSYWGLPFMNDTISLKEWNRNLSKQKIVRIIADSKKIERNYISYKKLYDMIDEISAEGYSVDDIKTEEDAFLYSLIKENEYVIDEKRIVDIFLDLTELEYAFDVEMPERLRKKFGTIHKKSLSVQDTVAGITRIEDFIAHEFMKGTKSFPMVLYRKTLSEDDKKYPLWVKSVFGEFAPFYLDDSVYIDIDENNILGNYLILPFTEKSYNTVVRENRKNGITKAKFDEITKDEQELKLLFKWVYRNQVCGNKKNYKKITEIYFKLLDEIYNICFEKK